jgi:glycosyltransferase involved in cell wall biosynthesis
MPISFIVPAFNCEKTLAETLRSICRTNISHGDELIIVNDGSTDSSLKIAEKFANKYSYIRLYSHEKNKGGASARNTAVSYAQNPLIFCLDSDNILMEHTVAPLKNFLLEKGADIAAFQCCFYFKDFPQNITHRWEFRPGITTLSDCFASEIVPNSSGNYLFTRKSWELVGGYPLDSRAFDAWGFGVRQLANECKMIVLEGFGYLHRYGYQSYWVREQSKGDNSILARALIEPYLDRLDEESLGYINTSPGREIWFDNLRERPLRLKGFPIGIGGNAVEGSVRLNISLKYKIADLVHAILLKRD